MTATLQRQGRRRGSMWFLAGSVTVHAGNYAFNVLTARLLTPAQYADVALTVAGLFVLRFRKPDLERPFRVPAYPFVPALFLVVAVFFLVFIAVGDPRNSGLGSLVMLSGVPAYFLFKRRGRQG